jgi:hypothetical protein
VWRVERKAEELAICESVCSAYSRLDAGCDSNWGCSNGSGGGGF